MASRSVKKIPVRRVVTDGDGNPVRDAQGRKVREDTGRTTWRARYRSNVTGKEYAKHFARKVDAERWLDEQTTARVTGQYVDPGAGRMTVRDYAETVWRPAQAHKAGTAEQVERILRNHVYPALGNRELASILPTGAQAYVRGLTDKGLSPGTVTVVFRYTAAIFKAAVRDRRIVSSPFDGLKPPRITTRKIEPLATETVEEIRDAMPDRYKALVIVAAGTGMRQGEVFGLTTDRVNLLARKVIVDRQLVQLKGRGLVFDTPKSLASIREIPLPKVVADALIEHLDKYPPGRDGLIFTNTYGEPMRRSTFNDLWARTLKEAKIPHTVFHSLRHYYASLLIRHGESVKTVQARLGHASASETLDTYAHLWPDSDDRTREAVDSVLGSDSAADALRTHGAS